MGGACYDRDVLASSSNRKFSDYADSVFNKSKADSSFLPRADDHSRVREIDCFHLNPVVCILDVTGSMGNWSKVIYDKLPLFFGEIEKQGYLEDPAISFAAVGDANCDRSPLQICDFSQSRELDDYLSRLWLEGGGGGTSDESYELMAYYYMFHCSLKRPGRAFMFICGDEGFYPLVSQTQVQKYFGTRPQITDSKALFRRLDEKFKVFLLHKKYGIERDDMRIVQQWREVLEEKVLMLDDPKAVIDVMLGAIALTSKTRDMDSYLADMSERGQTAERRREVRKSLEEYSGSLAMVKSVVKGILPVPSGDSRKIA